MEGTLRDGCKQKYEFNTLGDQTDFKEDVSPISVMKKYEKYFKNIDQH
jgi:hypothetical protein